MNVLLGSMGLLEGGHGPLSPPEWTVWKGSRPALSHTQQGQAGSPCHSTGLGAVS